MKNNFCLLLLSIFIFASCKKEDNNLPAPTHNGANILACKIDGKKFVVTERSFQAVRDGNTLVSDGTNWIILTRADDQYLSIGFKIPVGQLPVQRILGSKEFNRGTYIITVNNSTVPSSSTLYMTNEIDTGEVIITHFTNTYAPGTFYFNASNGDGKIIHITEGFFDVQFK